MASVYHVPQKDFTPRSPDSDGGAFVVRLLLTVSSFRLTVNALSREERESKEASGMADEDDGASKQALENDLLLAIVRDGIVLLSPPFEGETNTAFRLTTDKESGATRRLPGKIRQARCIGHGRYEILHDAIVAFYVNARLDPSISRSRRSSAPPPA